MSESKKQENWQLFVEELVAGAENKELLKEVFSGLQSEVSEKIGKSGALKVKKSDTVTPLQKSFSRSLDDLLDSNPFLAAKCALETSFDQVEKISALALDRKLNFGYRKDLLNLIFQKFPDKELTSFCVTFLEANFSKPENDFLLKAFLKKIKERKIKKSPEFLGILKKSFEKAEKYYEPFKKSKYSFINASERKFRENLESFLELLLLYGDTSVTPILLLAGLSNSFSEEILDFLKQKLTKKNLREIYKTFSEEDLKIILGHQKLREIWTTKKFLSVHLEFLDSESFEIQRLVLKILSDFDLDWGKLREKIKEKLLSLDERVRRAALDLIEKNEGQRGVFPILPLVFNGKLTEEDLSVLDSVQNFHKIQIERELLQKDLDSLPFSLSGGQEESLEEILGDLSGDFRMHRLLQGDVGCGKTLLVF